MQNTHKIEGLSMRKSNTKIIHRHDPRCSFTPIYLNVKYVFLPGFREICTRYKTPHASYDIRKTLM